MFRRMLLFCSMICLTSTLAAQFNSGRISGTVTDSAGAVIVGAKVTAVNSVTHLSQVSATGDSGFYAFPSLPAGPYDVIAEMQGFSAKKITGIVLDASADRTVEVTLAAGSTTETVTVDADSQQQIETTNAQVTDVITGKQVENIALNGRNYMQLVRLVPGTVVTILDPFSMQLLATGQNMNGVRGTSMGFQSDGISLLDPELYNVVVIEPSPEEISEARILSASFAAEYGSRTGSVTNVVTKSGTSTYHGSAYEFIRNDDFDAKSLFALARQPLHFNDYGYTLGGPVGIPHVFSAKDKFFFFFSQEWKYIHQGGTTLNTVPTDAQKSGVFSTTIKDPTTGLPFQNNTIPSSRFSLNGAALLRAFPEPNTQIGGSNFSFTGINKLDNREDRVNLDYAISDATRLSGHYAHSTNSQLVAFTNNNPTNLGPAPSGCTRPAYIYSAQVTHSFSSTLLNSFSIGQTHNVYNCAALTTVLLRPNLGLTFPEVFPFNAFNSAPVTAISGYTGFSPSTNTYKLNQTTEGRDDLSKVVGQHILKFGALLLYARTWTKSSNLAASEGSVSFSTSASNTSGNALADALLGNFYTYAETQTQGYYAAYYWQPEFYAQDNWKVNRRLTLDYGVRYIIPQNATNAYSTEGFFDASRFSFSNLPIINSVNGSITTPGPNPYNGIVVGGSGPTHNATALFPQLNNPAVRALYGNIPASGSKARLTDIAPRIGVALDPFGTGMTSIRAGFGAFYDRTYPFYLNFPSFGYPFGYTATVYSGSIDNPSGGATFPSGIFSWAFVKPSPVVYTDNLGIQQQLPGKVILDVSYVGTLGRHLLRDINLNQLPVGTATLVQNKGKNVNSLRPYPGYADIIVQQYQDASNYNSLQVSAQRRASKGLNFGVAYTFSKTMDTSAGAIPQNSYNASADYGRSAINRKHVLTINSVYELPFFLNRGNMLARQTLGGWTLSGVFSAQSGADLDVTLPNDNAGIGSSVFPGATGPSQRAQLIPGVNANLASGSRSLSKWFNTAAFSSPPVGQFSTTSRNILLGPGYDQLDLSAFKTFNIFEELRLQFRAEAFNLPNHGNYSSIGTTFGTSTFGSVTGATPGRVLQFALKASF